MQTNTTQVQRGDSISPLQQLHAPPRSMRRFLRIAAVTLGLLGSSAGAQTFELLHSFPDSGASGRRPLAPLSTGPDGNIYGTTSEGGAFDGGTAFRIWTDSATVPSGSVELVGHFNPATTGRRAISGLITVGGQLYGVTNSNQVPNQNKAGTLYKLDPSATISGSDLEGALSVVYQVSGSTYTDPYTARALTLGEPNAIYVLCEGISGIWRVPLDNPGAASVLRTFNNPALDGSAALSLTRGWDGFLYGTTYDGRAADGSGTIINGTIFRLDPSDPENDASMVRLHECTSETGTRPSSPLIQLPDGNFYGTLSDGGPVKTSGCLFRITPDGQFTIIYRFTLKNNGLYNPMGQLLYGSDGYLYGCTHFGGGKGGYGGVYRIKPDGTGYKMLHGFSGTDGGYPDHGLAQGADGNIYGTTFIGGAEGEGTVFRIKLKLPEIPENRPPVAMNDVVLLADADSFDVRANDYDPDGDGLIVSLVTLPFHGTVAVQPGGLIRYTPNGTYDGDDEFTYAISDGRSEPRNATVRIVSSTPGPLVQAGTYNGLLHLDPELEREFNSGTPRAQFTLKVSANRRFTGTLFTQRKRLPLRGTFDTDGSATVKLKIPGGGAATLFLAFQRGDLNAISGILYGQEFWSGVALPAVGSSSSAKQLYTVTIPPLSGFAAGAGYGTMTVLPSGAVTVKGKLGDGTTLSWSSTLVGAPSGPMFIPAFSEPLPGGLFAGYLQHFETPVAGANFGGPIQWIHPPATRPNQPYGFFEGVALVGASLYVPPTSKAPVLDITDGGVGLSGGPLANATGGIFTLSGNKVTINPPLRALSFNRANGLFTGKIAVEMQVGSKTVVKTISFSGAVNQALNNGFGQFSIGGVTGMVLLTEPENP